ncbi:DgyrCDS4500 [Dimorphilus gyrociliatus]|uniref:DgyrCDS4500 n=1 Tax=Dimorphilus gyrociliatus TaxID=2664684 RepID=A0A7I8VJE5_9ANNE|nr:DgyrCDS4500 [Dimorphilus gyrociliatus]
MSAVKVFSLFAVILFELVALSHQTDFVTLEFTKQSIGPGEKTDLIITPTYEAPFTCRIYETSDRISCSTQSVNFNNRESVALSVVQSKEETHQIEEVAITVFCSNDEFLISADNEVLVILPSDPINFHYIGETAQVVISVLDDDIAVQGASSTVTFTVSSISGNVLETEFIIYDNDLPLTPVGFPTEMTEGDKPVVISLKPDSRWDGGFHNPPDQVDIYEQNPVVVPPNKITNIRIQAIYDAVEVEPPIDKITLLDKNGGSLGDPHFTQFVVDSRTGKSMRICYDVTGEANNRIFIYKHLQSKTSLYGTLKNDYYMHEITVGSLVSNITVTTNYIKIDHDRKFEWKTSGGFELTKSKYYIIKFTKNVTKIESTDGRFGNVKFEIRRSMSNFKNVYLDVNILRLNNYKGIGDLLGEVGNSRFEFYTSVAEYEGEGMGSIKVNNHLFLATQKKRNGMDCWLIDADDVVYPKQLENFVY